MVSCCDKTLKVEDLLNQPLHGNNITPAVNIDPNFKCLLEDAIVWLVLFYAGGQGDAGNTQQLQISQTFHVSLCQEAVHQSNPHEHEMRMLALQGKESFFASEL